MKRIIPFFPLFILLPVFISLCLNAQIPVGTWRDHYSYSHALRVEETPGKIYCSTEGGLFFLDKKSNSLHTLSRVQGLSDHGISAMAYAPDVNTLILVYENTNIDLINDSGIKNINDIYRKVIPGIKKINDITVVGSFAYLSTSFGVIVLNLNKNEIKDTYYIGENGNPLEIFGFTRFGSFFYAATANGIYRAPAESQNLVYYEAWEHLNTVPSPNRKYNHIIAVQNNLLANRSDESMAQDTLYLYDGNIWVPFLAEPLLKQHSIKFINGYLLVSSSKKLHIYDQYLNAEYVIDDLIITSSQIRDALIDSEGILRIANHEGGLISSTDFSGFESNYPDGPYTDDAFALSAWKDHLAVAGGGRDIAWNNVFRNGMLYTYSQGFWHSIINLDIRDIVQVVPDPLNDQRMYAATWGYGILVFNDQRLIKTWNEDNSSLQSIIPGSPFVRIGGMAFDPQHRLWVTNTGVNEPISVKTDDDSWISIPYGPYINAPTVGNILISQNGTKWVQLPRGYGLFIFDDNNTPNNIDDDRFKKISVIDQEGQSHNDVYCLAEDHSGYIWVGTSQGPIVYFNPGGIFDKNGATAQRILVPRKDGSGLADYLLSTEKINTIAIDGADRKWFGTEKAGVFLISPDGTEKILNFNTGNSPLPSNLIYSIAIEPENGEVFFATDKGVISYRGSATKPAQNLESVYAFPNPVREGWQGKVTITGLSEGVNVKITDISGNLVFETRSLGGQAFWNRKNMDGREVNTGIYLVFISNDDGSQTQVIKILVVK